MAQELQIETYEKPFLLTEVFKAKEVFVSGSTAFIKPVSHIDDKIIAEGTVGPITEKLMTAYYRYCYGN
jgi:branched-subunit amino acid aminotransferase/4-amino-4-deoxychorismate lyase